MRRSFGAEDERSPWLDLHKREMVQSFQIGCGQRESLYRAGRTEAPEHAKQSDGRGEPVPAEYVLILLLLTRKLSTRGRTIPNLSQTSIKSFGISST